MLSHIISWSHFTSFLIISFHLLSSLISCDIIISSYHLLIWSHLLIPSAHPIPSLHLSISSHLTCCHLIASPPLLSSQLISCHLLSVLCFQNTVRGEITHTHTYFTKPGYALFKNLWLLVFVQAGLVYLTYLSYSHIFRMAEEGLKQKHPRPNLTHK